MVCVVDTDCMPGRMQQERGRVQIELAEGIARRRVTEAGRIGQIHLTNVEFLGVQEKVHPVIAQQAIGQLHAGVGAALLSAGRVRIAALRIRGVRIQVGGLVQLRSGASAAIEQSTVVTLPRVADIAGLLARALPHADAAQRA